MNLHMLGIDIAKSTFQLHGADSAGKEVLKKRLPRHKLAAYIANLPACTIVMESCGGANYWARVFQRSGHTVKLISPQFVKPFVKTNKNDANDALAIVEAASRLSMNFVPIKQVERFCRETGSADRLSYTPVLGISIFGQIVISFKGRHHQQEIILQCVRWYVAYSLSYRDLEELMQERGYAVDHSTVQRWVVHYAPRIEKAFQKNKKRVGNRWRLDETYIKIRGEWKYLYRAVDKQGNTIDFLLTAKRDKKAARRFLNKAIGANGKPSLINIDKSGANTAAIKQYNNDENRRVKIRQCKYLNNIVEQDHRFIKRRIRPMLGFKSFWSAQATLAGIELWRMLKKGQNKSYLPAWEQFYALALTG